MLQFVVIYYVMLGRDAPIAIFLADSDFFFFRSVTCRYRFLSIPIFFLRTIIDRIYKLFNKINVLHIFLNIQINVEKMQ